MSDRPDAELYLTTHNTYQRQTSMSPAEFEPAIPASEQPQTDSLDRAATGISEESIRPASNHIVIIYQGTASHTCAVRTLSILIGTNGLCFGCVYEAVRMGFVFENPDPYFYSLNTPSPPPSRPGY
jgi:hypothetical protein